MNLSDELVSALGDAFILRGLKDQGLTFEQWLVTLGYLEPSRGQNSKPRVPYLLTNPIEPPTTRLAWTDPRVSDFILGKGELE